MGVVIDHSRGRFYLPNPVTLTLTRPASQTFPEAQEATVERCQEQHADEDAVEDGLDRITRVFHLWRAETPDLRPHRGFLITNAAGEVYEIQRVETLAHGERYRCHCSLRHPRT